MLKLPQNLSKEGNHIMHHPLTLPTQSSPKIEITEGQGLFPQLSDIVNIP